MIAWKVGAKSSLRGLKPTMFLPNRTCRNYFIGAALCSSINKVFITLPEFFFGLALDVVLSRPNLILIGWGLEHLFGQLCFLVGCIAVIWLLASVFYFLEIILWQQYAQKLQHQLRMQLYEHAYKRLDPHQTVGNTVTIINDDINQIEQFFRFSAHDTIHLAVGALIIGGMYCYYVPWVGIAAIVPLPCIVALSLRFQKKLQRAYVVLRNQAGTLAAKITTALTQHTFSQASIEHESLHYQALALEAARINAFFNPLIALIIAVGVIGTVLVSGYYTLQGYLSPGIFGVIFLQTQRLLWPFARTAQLIDAYERTMASMVRIQLFLQKTEIYHPAVSDRPQQHEQKNNQDSAQL